MMHRSRGQVLPVWILAMIANLAMLLFVANLSNVVRWQIRAQNAADSAAGYGLSQLGSYANELTTELYALQVNEFRIRYLNSAIVAVLAKYRGNPTDGTLQNQLDTLVYDLSIAENNADALINHSMTVADSNTKGGLQNVGSNVSYLNSNCPQTYATSADCAFSYTSKGAASGTILADVVSCKSVPTFAPQFLGLTGASAFKAVGRATEQLAAQEITFSPGSTDIGSVIVPTSGTVGRYQPDETFTNSYKLEFSNMTMTNGFYEISPVAPTTAIGTYGCS